MDHPAARAPTFDEIATDCWVTPPDVLVLVDLLWPGGIDLDPFWDPGCLVKSRAHYDIRKGQDAYKKRWGEPGDRIWVQGPYSGSNPAKTAARAARYGVAGRHILNLCPAAPGSAYWQASVWPWVDAIAWCGRMSFVAGRDILDEAGNVKHKAGEVVDGNRTEIALNYQGPHARAFARIFARAYPVTVNR